MSLNVSLTSLSNELREKISQDLTISIEPVKKGFNNKSVPFPQKTGATMEAYDFDGNDILILPLAYGIHEIDIPKPNSQDYPKLKSDCNFVGTLREEQKAIKDEAINNLNMYNACLISAYPGFGKTCTSIYITSKIKLQTLIIINRLVLMKQWEEAIKKFCINVTVVCADTKMRVQKSPNKKQKKTEDEELPPDYIIINAINIPKMGKDFFKNVGVVIVDEAHLIMSQVLSKGLFYVFPRYIIGLSATPYRSDGMDKLLTLYFTDKKIIRTLKRNHTVFKVETGFTPEVEYDRNGKVIWGHILEQQCMNPQRNGMIINIIQNHPTRIFLVLSKRIEQAQYLYDRLKEGNENVSLLIGSKTTFDKDARILIGTSSKIGVGFDHSRMDALLLASDLEQYFIQYLGRVFRTEDVEPIIFDLVDNNSILKRHFSTRKGVYIESGGKIVKYNL